MNDNVAAVIQTQMKKMGSHFYEQSKPSHPTNHLFFNEIIIICIMKSAIWAGEIGISLMYMPISTVIIADFSYLILF